MKTLVQKSKRIHLSISERTERLQIKVFNMLGQKVDEQTLDTQDGYWFTYLMRLAPGNYPYIIENEFGKLFHGKFLYGENRFVQKPEHYHAS